MNVNEGEIQVKHLNEMSPVDVYGMCGLRYNVFVFEQKSIFDEYDGKDVEAFHVFIKDQEKIIAYARVFKADEITATFGRVAVDQEHRKEGLGRKMVTKAIEVAKRMEGVKEIKIEAQEYLKEFYGSFGFVQTSEPFDDAGVMHVEMRMQVAN